MTFECAIRETIVSLGDRLLWGMQRYGAGFESIQHRLLWVDDFLGKQLKDEWRSTGDVGGSAVVVDQQTGGICRLITDNDSNDDWSIDWSDIRSLHVDQKISMEVRVKLNSIVNTMVVLYLFTAGNNNYISFWFTTATHVTWRLLCRDGGISTDVDSGVAFDTDYHIFRIECHTHGGSHVHFYIDGVEPANSPVTTNIPDDAVDYLQPRLWIRTLENVAKSMDVDYVVVRQER